jgi:hypothetical protein
VRVTAIQTQTEQKRQDRSVRCAEKHLWRAKKPRVHGLNRPVPAACATADAAQDEKHFSSTQNQAILTSDASLLGECRLRGWVRKTSFGVVPRGCGPQFKQARSEPKRGRNSRKCKTTAFCIGLGILAFSAALSSLSPSRAFGGHMWFFSLGLWPRA